MAQLDFTQWQSCYSVGNWMLNNQHKVLLGLCRQIIECVLDDGLVLGRFSIIRNDLLESVDEHFRTEENLLRNCAYPHLLRHTEEHLESRAGLTEFLMSATNPDQIDKEALGRFLAQWWFHHVLESDKKFVGAIHRVN
ncbi:MAG: hemerythrin family protein [Azonexus sp.]